MVKNASKDRQHNEFENDWDDLISSSRPFGGGADEFGDEAGGMLKLTNKNAQRGKSSTNGLRRSGNLPPAGKRRKGAQQAGPGAVEKLFNLPQVIQSQIASTIVADEIIRDHKAINETKATRISEQLEYVKEMENKLESFKSQKDQLGAK